MPFVPRAVLKKYIESRIGIAKVIEIIALSNEVISSTVYPDGLIEVYFEDEDGEHIKLTVEKPVRAPVLVGKMLDEDELEEEN